VEGLAALAGPCLTAWAGQRTAKSGLSMASQRLRFKSVDHSEPSRHRPNPALANRLVTTPRHRAFGSLLLFCWSWATGFVLGAMSRRTIWFDGILFGLALLFLGSQLNRPGPYQDGVYQYSVDGWPLPLMFYRDPPADTADNFAIASFSVGYASRSPAPEPLAADNSVGCRGRDRTVCGWPFHGSWPMRLRLAVYWPVGYLAVTEIGRRWHHRGGFDLASRQSARKN
jgi:hypothetical protein